MNEDLVRQIANGLTERLLGGAKEMAKPEVAQPLIIFCEDSTEQLRSNLRTHLSRAEFTDQAPIKPVWSGYSMLVLAAPSLDLVSKIRHLHTDCPTARLTIDALCNGKRVVALMEGVLSSHPSQSLPSGLARAITDLRSSLGEMGIEVISSEEVGRLSQPSAAAQMAIKTGCGCQKEGGCGCTKTGVPPAKSEQVSSAIASLPVHQHPSQQRLSTSDPLSEFIEFLQTKPCRMEKDKPCDHCDICNTFGF